MKINVEKLESIISKPFFKEILKNGGEVYFVGGATRDMFLDIEPKDIDLCTRLLSYHKLSEILSKHGKVDLVGESFGVIKFKELETNWEAEISITRTDQLDKTKKGHTAIIAQSNHLLSIECDLRRRDLTINSFCISHTFSLIDPFNGVGDLQEKIIRATDSSAFIDDPLRMLRAIGFASRLSFAIEPKTFELIKQHKHLIKEISPERILMEFQKVIDKKGDCIIFLDLMDKTGLWKEIFDYKIQKKYITIPPSTISELLFSTIDREPSLAMEWPEFFENKLKIDNKTYKELNALCIARGSKYLKDLPLTRYVAFSVLKSCPWAFDLPYFDMKGIDKQDFLSGKYPMSYKHIDISGDTLVLMGYEGKACGMILNKILNAILDDKLVNEYEAIKTFINEQC